eukprot:4985135-Pyramimonas_sp.AAC.1
MGVASWSVGRLDDRRAGLADWDRDFCTVFLGLTAMLKTHFRVSEEGVGRILSRGSYGPGEFRPAVTSQPILG